MNKGSCGQCTNYLEKQRACKHQPYRTRAKWDGCEHNFEKRQK